MDSFFNCYAHGVKTHSREILKSHKILVESYENSKNYESFKILLSHQWKCIEQGPLQNHKKDENNKLLRGHGWNLGAQCANWPVLKR